ncbi:MAG: hypothetical protein V7K14_13705 [Nostoc sp.]|uniref:hypothetical protein n=1 Tax=Nostoc sp. TaxID=1180 RepID=UPI002FF80C54
MLRRKQEKQSSSKAIHLCLCVLVNALISAIAFSDGTAEIFNGDAELDEVVVRLVNTHEELAPLPYQNLQL